MIENYLKKRLPNSFQSLPHEGVLTGLSEKSIKILEVKKMLDVIAKRQSTRKFSDQPVAKELLLKIVESGSAAPSAINSQPWDFIIITSDEQKERILEHIPKQDWMKTVPAFIATIADVKGKDDSIAFVDEKSEYPELKGSIRDTAVATGYMLLEAENLGLASCWTGWFEQSHIRPALDVPEDKFVVSLLAFGYSDEPNREKKRRPLEDMVRYETW